MPELGPRDLFFVSAGPGDVATARALVGVAHKASARTAPDHRPRRARQARRHSYGRRRRWPTTRAASSRSLPMGSLFETAQVIAFEIAIFKLRPR